MRRGAIAKLKKNLLPYAMMFGCVCSAQEASQSLLPFFPPPGRVIIAERSDFSRYEDGRYMGHVYRESRVDLGAVTLPDEGFSWAGEALVLEETLRDNRTSARKLDGSIPIAFKSDKGGVIIFSKDEGYPILRGIPLSPQGSILAGQRWTGDGVVVVRPKADAPATRIPVLAEYEFMGKTTWNGIEAYSISARYGIRYKGSDRLGDPALKASQGGRSADIVIDARDGSTLFVRETVDETYTYASGATIRLKGFILHFHRGTLPVDRERIALALKDPAVAPPSAPAAPPAAVSPAAAPVAAPPVASQPVAPPPAAASSPPGPFELATSKRGIVLLLFDLRFAADSAELLSSEKSRLDAIAQALARIPDRTFLVEGHTAEAGKPQGQYLLSEQRAKKIVDELVARGIPAGRFLFKGMGADKPIAPNDTEQNKARNRRVEITVLD